MPGGPPSLSVPMAARFTAPGATPPGGPFFALADARSPIGALGTAAAVFRPQNCSLMVSLMRLMADQLDMPETPRRCRFSFFVSLKSAPLFSKF